MEAANGIHRIVCEHMAAAAKIHAVEGEDYIPQFADWDYCESRGMYLDQHCDPNCATPDEDCSMDENGDGDVNYKSVFTGEALFRQWQPYTIIHYCPLQSMPLQLHSDSNSLLL